MQVTIDIPNNLPQERVRQRLKEIEESLREEARFLESLKNEPENSKESDDPWTSPAKEPPSVDTGVEDPAVNHNYYL